MEKLGPSHVKNPQTASESRIEFNFMQYVIEAVPYLLAVLSHLSGGLEDVRLA
jgi:hypothetical protein